MNVRKTDSNGPGIPAPDAKLSLLKEGKPDKPLVYVASPFSGDVERNIMNARRYCRFAAESGAVPLAPHLLLPQFISEKNEREAAMLMNRAILGRCDELWMFGGRITDGMAAEIAKAQKRRIPIRYFTDDCKEKNDERIESN